MTTETQAAFARRIGHDRSHVTRLKQDGRLAMTLDGLVEVEASLRRMQDTGGARPDVKARHDAAKVSPRDTAPPPFPSDQVGDSYQKARAVKEKYAALDAKLAYEARLGSLLPKDAVDLALKALGGAVRGQMAMYADRVAPLVAPVVSQDEVHALLDEACRGVLAAVSDELTRQEAALRAEAAA